MYSSRAMRLASSWSSLPGSPPSVTWCPLRHCAGGRCWCLGCLLDGGGSATPRAPYTRSYGPQVGTLPDGSVNGAADGFGRCGGGGSCCCAHVVNGCGGGAPVCCSRRKGAHDGSSPDCSMARRWALRLSECRLLVEDVVRRPEHDDAGEANVPPSCWRAPKCTALGNPDTSFGLAYAKACRLPSTGAAGMSSV